MNGEYWLHRADHAAVGETERLYPRDAEALRRCGFSPIGVILAWSPGEVPALPPRADATMRRYQAIVRAALEMRGWETQWLHADRTTIASFGDAGGQPELLLSSVLLDGSAVRTVLQDDALFELLDCTGGRMYSGWPDGGIFEQRLARGGVDALWAAHQRLLAEAVAYRGSPPAQLRDLEDALLLRRLAVRCALRFGQWLGQEDSRSAHAEMGAGLQAASAAQMSALREQARADGVPADWFDSTPSAFTFEQPPVPPLLDLAALRRLPTQPVTHRGAVGDWAE